MSDEDDYEYEYDDDDMEEEFQYTDEEGEESQDDVQVELENGYYNSKSLRDDHAAQAINSFESVIQKETSVEGKPGKWSFKAMKQLVKLHLRRGDAESTEKDYRRLLECTSQGVVSPNAIEKGISGMLERIASLYQGNRKETTHDAANQQLALAVYDTTLSVFHPTLGKITNERLWFKTNIKYGQLLYEMNETVRLQQVLRDLQSTVTQNDDATSSSSTQSMEIYALQIQLFSRQQDHKRLRETFKKAMAVRGGIPHPRTIALIQELGGKMHMSSREYDMAEKTFFQAFKSYDEAGDPSRLRCLKYLVLASMLHASTINPFDSQEARPYRDDPEIVAMTNLVQAFHANDIATFETILKKNRRTLNDEFINEHVQDLLRTIRTQVITRIIRPFTRISLASLAKQLNDIPVNEVEALLTTLILNKTLAGHIDRVEMVLYKSVPSTASRTTNDERAKSLHEIGRILGKLSSQVVVAAGST